MANESLARTTWLTNYLVFSHHQCVILRLSEPLKAQYAKDHNLNINQLLDATAYKEKYRADMIKWGEEMRQKDPDYFCNLAISQNNAANYPIWIVSDARRPTDISYFKQNYPSQTILVRVVAEETVRWARGWKFVAGIDDADSECALDEGINYDVVIDNSSDEPELNTALDKLYQQAQTKLRQLCSESNQRNEDVTAQTPKVPSKQMSAKLKEKLKHSGRAYRSPAAAADTQHVTKPKVLTPFRPVRSARPFNESKKNLFANDSQQGGLDSKDEEYAPQSKRQKISDSLSTDVHSKVTPNVTSIHSLSVKESAASSKDIDEITALHSEVAGKTEVLRKLNLVKTYREKNNLEKLDELIKKWTNATQEMLQTLLQRASEPKPTMAQLLEQLQIQADMVHYNEDNDCFDSL